MYNNIKFNEVIICAKRYIKDFQSSYGKMNVEIVVPSVIILICVDMGVTNKK